MYRRIQALFVFRRDAINHSLILFVSIKASSHKHKRQLQQFSTPLPQSSTPLICKLGTSLPSFSTQRQRTAIKTHVKVQTHETTNAKKSKEQPCRTDQTEHRSERVNTRPTKCTKLLAIRFRAGVVHHRPAELQSPRFGVRQTACIMF